VTDWSRYTVPQLWQLLSSDDGEITDEQISTWDALYRDMQAQATRLDAIRTRIESTWPPERSPAARAFSDLLADIRDSTRSTAEAAVANGSALRAISGAVRQTRGKLTQLMGEYWDDAAARRTYEREVSGFERFWDSMPWADDEQRMWQVHHHVLSEQGRAAMRDLDQTAFEAQSKMMQPPAVPEIRSGVPWPPPADELPLPSTTSRYGGFAVPLAVNVPEPANVAPPPLSGPVPGPDYGFVIGGGSVLTPVEHPAGGTVLVPIDENGPAIVGTSSPVSGGPPGVVPGGPNLPGPPPGTTAPTAHGVPAVPGASQWVVPTHTGPALRPGGVVGALPGASPVAGRPGAVPPVFPPSGVVGPAGQRQLIGGGFRPGLTNPATIYPMAPPPPSGAAPPRGTVAQSGAGSRGVPGAGPTTMLPPATGIRSAAMPPARPGPLGAPAPVGGTAPQTASSPAPGGTRPGVGGSGSAALSTVAATHPAGGGSREYHDESYARLADPHRYRRDRTTAERRDPADPWQVEESIPPVITPPAERPHDPGPGVVGINK
jgi:hypothetical protein